MSLATRLAERRRRLGFITRLIARLDKRRRYARAKKARSRKHAQERAIAKLARLIRKRRKRRKRSGQLRYVNVNTSDYAGARSVMIWVEGFMQKRGLPLGSHRRTPTYNAAIGGSSTSSHLTTNMDGDARDFPTYSGADDAIALAHALGQRSWRPGTYNTFVVTVDGYRFQFQILWAVSGHYDHVHVGIERV